MSTTTDKELLELAAKAAGIEINAARQAEREACGFGGAGLWTTTTTHWNPLKDDGDALRLAVKLSIEPKFRLVGQARTDTILAANGWQPSASEYWTADQDRYAATRRAIVRAAAEIGKAMP